MAAESDGWAVILVAYERGREDTTMFANIVKTKKTQKSARNYAQRIRNKAKVDGDPRLVYKVFVRPNWKW